jgi:polygalacturonase
MSLTIGHSTNVIVKNWSVLQPAFWATLIWDSKNVLFKDVYVNATRENDEGYEPTPLGWVQNTDGSDTYLSHNVTYGQ